MRRILLASALLLAAVARPARAAEVAITWDRDVAFEHDRAEYERTLRSWVESGYAEASTWLGMTVAHPLTVHVYAPARYAAAFGEAAAWRQGAHYQAGRIHVNGGNRLDDRFAGMLVHEMTHAVLDRDGTAQRLPTWVNEGLAERLQWMRRGLSELASNQRSELKYAPAGSLTPLPAHARLGTFGYLQAYAAVLFLEQRAGKAGLLAIVRRTLQGVPFERALEDEIGWPLPRFERELVAWVEHLP